MDRAKFSFAVALSLALFGVYVFEFLPSNDSYDTYLVGPLGAKSTFDFYQRYFVLRERSNELSKSGNLESPSRRS